MPFIFTGQGDTNEVKSASNNLKKLKPELEQTKHVCSAHIKCKRHIFGVETQIMPTRNVIYN